MPVKFEFQINTTHVSAEVMSQVSEIHNFLGVLCLSGEAGRGSSHRALWGAEATAGRLRGGNGKKVETKLQLAGSLQEESEVPLTLTAGVTVLLRGDAGCS